MVQVYSSIQAQPPSSLQNSDLVYALLDLQEDTCLPVVQLRHLIELEYSASKSLEISTLNSIAEDIYELRLPGRGEGGV